ncbi:MAG: alginate export family protein [Deltaproteobacteria bacterium]|nr:alginate export family protein [Deltaproteobacteria bacterium]
MKRILLSVFAAAITAAWVVPASAADVTLSGQYRLRGEYRNNVDFTDNTSDSRAAWTQRVRLTTNAKATDDTSVKVTLQDTRTWGQNGSGALLTDASSTNNTVDLHEAFLNINNVLGTPVTLKVGRQELAYGDERIIGSFGWSNNGRAFDAAKIVYGTDAVNVDVFLATVDEDSVDTDATLNDDTVLNGVYATLKQVVPNNTVDLYLIHQSNGTALTRYTLGARVKGSAAGLDYTLELPYQFGEESDTVDISAYAFAAKVGYNLPTPTKIRVGAEFDYGSGDDGTDATSNDNWTDLFPTNHAHFGYADVSGANSWSNLMAFSVNATAALNEKTSLYAAYWNFTKNEVASGADDSVGSEIDVTATYKYNNAVTAEIGGSYFIPGDGLAVDGDNQSWGYLMLTANF